MITLSIGALSIVVIAAWFAGLCTAVGVGAWMLSRKGRPHA